jgi:hypothetical protein
MYIVACYLTYLAISWSNHLGGANATHQRAHFLADVFNGNGFMHFSNLYVFSRLRRRHTHATQQ